LNKSQIIIGWSRYGLKWGGEKGTKYFDRDKDHNKRLWEKRRTILKGKGSAPDTIFSGEYLRDSDHDILTITAVFRKE
jgi:hypothetical protein